MFYYYFLSSPGKHQTTNLPFLFNDRNRQQDLCLTGQVLMEILRMKLMAGGFAAGRGHRGGHGEGHSVDPGGRHGLRPEGWSMAKAKDMMKSGINETNKLHCQIN